MEWMLAVLIGLIIGTLFSLIAQSTGMPTSLCLVLGVIGAVAGGSLERLTGFTLGAWTFYIAAAALAIGLLGGGLLSYTLTARDRRV